MYTVFPHQRIKPWVVSRHPGIAIMPLGLRPPQMPCRCYNPEQVSVCQINGKTYWTGTKTRQKKSQTNFALKSGSAIFWLCQIIYYHVWQYNPNSRKLTPLRPLSAEFSNTTHHLLGSTTPSWPGIAGFVCLKLSAVHTVPLNNAT